MSVSDILTARCGEVSQTLSDMTQAKPARDHITQDKKTILNFLNRLIALAMVR